jgi:signal transduction histidine kinase
MEHQVALDVRDDGRGFDPAETKGFGLVAMRQRIEALSGTLQVESEPGAGTAISASLPAEAAEAPETAKAPEAATAPEPATAPEVPEGARS